MKTLHLPSEELARMQAFYEEELRKTIAKLEHIKAVLTELGKDSTQIDIRVSQKNQISSSVVERDIPQRIQKKRRKKSGPKSIWGNFIIKRLRQLDKPTTYATLIDDAMVYFKVPENKRNNIKQAIVNSAFRLRNLHHKINTYGKKGKKEKFVGLAKWFEEDGNLKEEYKKKIKTNS